MIFVTVGSTHFDPLIEALDHLVGNGMICEEIVAQTGSGTYRPKHLTCFRFAPDLVPYYTKADLVICHGGVGTVFELMVMGKRFIAVPNKALQDDHQTDLLKALANQRWCVVCANVESIKQALASDRPRKRYPIDTELPQIVWDFLIGNLKAAEKTVPRVLVSGGAFQPPRKGTLSP